MLVILGGGNVEGTLVAIPMGWQSVMGALRTVLVLNDAAEGTHPSDVQVISLPYSKINARAIDDIRPDLIILPLFGPGFDAIDALAQLERFGFRGDVLVRSPNLPNSRLVERELSAVVPTLRIKLVGPQG